jgi:osomolarity two-component system response regulator SKN7
LELPPNNGEGSSSNSSQNDTAVQSFNDGNDDDRINPIAGLGLTDEQYNLIIQDIVNAETFHMGGGADGGGGSSSGSNVMMDGIGMMSAAAMLGAIGEKRGLDDPSDGREVKRSRFEVIE